MITVQARSASIGVCLLLLLGGCSREQQDWRAAEGADSMESYGQFIERHPDSELVSQARTRVAQLGEVRDWQRAGSADTVTAYRDFLQQHPAGKWAQEARIRIENFSLSEQTGTDPGTKTGGAGASGMAKPSNSGTAASPSGTASSSVAAVGASRDGESGTAAIAHGIGDDASGLATAASGSSADAHGLAQPGEYPTAYGIQLGAFTSEASANAQWHTLVTRFGSDLKGLQEHLVTADTASGRVYRLQAQVGTEARARALCDSLKRQGQGCVAVLPH